MGRGKKKKKTYIDRDVDVNAIMRNPRPPLLVVLLGCVVAYHEGILGELLDKAFGGYAIDVEVEGLG